MSRYWLKTLVLSKWHVVYCLNLEAHEWKANVLLRVWHLARVLLTGGAVWTDRQSTRLVPQLFALIRRNLPKKIINVISYRCVKHFYRVTVSSVTGTKTCQFTVHCEFVLICALTWSSPTFRRHFDPPKRRKPVARQHCAKFPQDMNI